MDEYSIININILTEIPYCLTLDSRSIFKPLLNIKVVIYLCFDMKM